MRSRLCFVTISLSFAPDRGAWALSAFGLCNAIFSCCTCPLQVGSFRYTPLHYGVTVRKEYLTGIERSRVKTFKENKLEFRTFAETSSSETRIVFVRIAINEENDRIQTNIEQQSKHCRYDTYSHGNLGSPIVSKSL